MRHNIVAICSVILGTFFASGAFAVDLRDATNQQILDELANRLRTGGGGSGGGAVATYLCDTSGYFTFSIVGSTGTEKSTRIYIGDQNFCQRQSTFLASHRNRINNTTVIAICDSSYMNRYSITPSGEVNALARQYFGDMNNCLNQAEANNGLL